MAAAHSDASQYDAVQLFCYTVENRVMKPDGGMVYVNKSLGGQEVRYNLTTY